MMALKTRYSRRIGWLVLVMSLLTATTSLPAAGPVDDIDVKNLSDMLNTYGMGEILDELARLSNSPALRVNLLLRQAQSAANPQEADKLYLEALTLLDQIIKTEGQVIEKPPADAAKRIEWDQAVVRYYKAKLQKIKVTVLDRGAQYINRLVYLLGSDADREGLSKLIGDNIKQLEAFDKELSRRLRDYTKPEHLIFLVPELEMTRDLALYQGSFVRYYAAMSMPKLKPDGSVNDERLSLLDDAVADAKRLLKKADWEENQPNIYLLIGNCEREAGRYADAAAALKKAQDLGEGPVVTEAGFVAARNLAEWGASLISSQTSNIDEGQAKFQDALRQVAAFAQSASEAGQQQTYVDITSLSLEFFIYDLWADSLTKAGKPDMAKTIIAQGMEKLTAFIKKYTDNAGVMAFVGRRFRDKFIGMPKKDLPSAILLFVGRTEMDDGARMIDVEKKSPEAPEVSEKLQSARDFLTELTGRKSDDAVKLQPDAQYLLGVVNLYMGDNFKAIEAFRRVVELDPKHEQAQKAADNAIRLANALIQEQLDANQPVSRERRTQLVESAQVFLKYWPDDKAAPTHRGALAWNAEKLADIAENEAEKGKWLDLAIAEYGKVPESSDIYPRAQFYGMDLRYRKIMESSDPSKLLEEARKLEQELVRYGAVTHEKWKAASGDEKGQLGEYGSLAEFRAAELAYNLLDMKTKALEKIGKLPQRWPGTPVLRDANSFLIRKLLEEGNVSEGIAEFRKFQKDYPDKAQELINQIVTVLSDTIEKLAIEGGADPRLPNFRKAYLEFTRQLYEADKESKDPAKRYQAITMYGDALLQAGTKEDAQKALDLFGILQKEVDEENAKKLNVAKAYLTSHMKAAEGAKGNIQAAKALKSQYEETIKHFFGNKKWLSPEATNVNLAFANIDNPDVPVEDRAGAVAANVLRAYKRILDDIEKRQHLDPTVLRGLARGEIQLEQYEKALPKFKLLTRAIDVQKYPDWYWQAQVNYCKCLMEVNRQSPKDLLKLLDYLQQIRDDFSGMGGPRYLRQFNAIQNQAQDIIRNEKK